MTYVKNNWVDQEVERPKTYEMTNNSDGSVTLIDSFGLVSELGTPVNADNMNHIEEGIAGCDLRKHNLTETFGKGEWVTGVVEDEKGIYESLTDNNYGNPLTDNTKWQKVELGGGSGFNLFDLVIKDHVLSYEESKGFALQGTYVYKAGVTGSRYGYPDFYAKCLEEKNAGTPTQTSLGGSTITTYNNSNGHIYYDIADKAVLDTFFNTYGIADFYGVDTENERIFLPRNRWFMQLTTDASKVNSMNEAGLPNINGDFPDGRIYTTTSYNYDFPPFKKASVTTYTAGTEGSSKDSASIVGFDASTSNPIYGKSNTVQPASSNKLLYYCVGNTEVTSSVTNVVDITTSENDTIPLGYSTYQGEGLQPSAAWLASNGQWNSGQVYTSFYNEYVPLIGQKFAAGYVRNHTDEYTDYDLVLNQDDMTFRLPLLNGEEGNGTLYFKVANAVENLELLNVGEVMNTLATKANVAPWNMKWMQVTTGQRANGIKIQTFDLSSYLPNDNNDYELLMGVLSWTQPTSGKTSILDARVATNIFNIIESSEAKYYLPVSRTGGTITTNQASAAIVPIGSAKQLILRTDVSNSAGNNLQIYLYGYRRVG